VFIVLAHKFFRNKFNWLYFFSAASLITSFVQIIIEAVMVDHYNKGGSQQWLSGCEILSSCLIEKGPSSAVSQIYNEVENMMKIVIAEVVGNFFSLVVTAISTYLAHQDLSQSAGLPNPTRENVIICLNFFEMLLEVGQVACSVLAFQSMEGSINPVNELFSSLVGKYSEKAGLCVLPCCGFGNKINC
jgi:hypothetical protein